MFVYFSDGFLSLRLLQVVQNGRFVNAAGQPELLQGMNVVVKGAPRSLRGRAFFFYI